MSSAIEPNRTHRKGKYSIERSIFELLIFVKPALKIYNQILEDRVTWSLARGFLKRRNSAEMASDALWVVSFKCVVKGYQECRFDVKDGEVFNVLKKVGEKGRAFRIVNERGQLGHLQRELVSSLWPVNASITW